MPARPVTAAAAAVFAAVVVAPGSVDARRPHARFDVRPPVVSFHGRASAGVYRALAHARRVHVIVALRRDLLPTRTRLARIRTAAAATEGRVLAGVERRSVVVRERWRASPGFIATVTRHGLAALLRSPEVARVGLDIRLRPTLTESVPLIKADQVQARGITGKGVTVAMLDTGVDVASADLADDIVDQECFVHTDAGGGCPNGRARQSGSGSAADADGHGTTVAAIVTSDGTASPKGVAPAAKIVAVKVVGPDGALTSDIVSALDWIATSRPDVKVVNLSLGTDELYPGSCDDANASTLMYASEIDVLRARGVTVFAASGNEASSASMAAPACVSGTVSVGAVYDAAGGSAHFTESGCADAVRAADKIACFSDSDSALDLLSPGGAITTAKLGGGLTTTYGTSAAAPHATAVAALMLEARPTLTPEQLESTLKQTGVKITDARNSVVTPRVDALAAVDALPALPPPPPPPAYLPAGSASFADGGGDGGVAGDLGTVSAASGVRGILTFQVATPNRPSLASGESVVVFLDTDRNPATGSPAGSEYAVDVSSSGDSTFYRWAATWQPIRPVGDASYAEGIFTFKLAEDAIGTTGDFAFSVQSFDSAGVAADRAPDTGEYPFPAVPLSVARTGTGAGTVSGGATNGIACGDICTALFARDAFVPLTAAAAPGSAFVEWGEACSGSGACTVATSEPRTVSARFELLRRVAVTVEGTGAGVVTSAPGGIACEATCAASYPNGTTLGLTAQADAGSRFDGWSNACTGADACSLGVDGDKAVTATFADVAPPVARPLAARGKRGRSVRLRYRVSDNADHVSVDVTVFAGRRRVATRRRTVAAGGAPQSLAWHVPRRFRGRGRFCVQATDAAGNRSARGCAALRIS